MSAILEVKNLKTTFKTDNGTVSVVDGVDFSIKPGETLGVVGESGCGKSVTSLSVMRLLPSNASNEGSITFQGQELISLPEKHMQKVRGNDIAMIFQEPMTSLNPLHTVGRQIEESVILHMNISKQEAKARAIKMLNAVGMPRAQEIYGEYPHQLSGGMRQRVMIAMAMACDPQLIIADEPTTALDVTIQAQILDLMRDLKNKTGTSIMLITHDLGVVAEMCDRVIVMYAGQVVEETDVETLFENPKHPYTIGLIDSIPSFEDEKEYLNTIPGSVPLPYEMPKGCRFAPRCSWAKEICHQQAPELKEIENQHKCRCWLVTEEDAS
ncbi:ABC transporter ATP-binding protein [Bacillus sp. EB106-08-02-XG196]|uniref:ABC transporter ATP-binding protein n=1 Tax=Bacillus sp. EB106-08-02-XG196 TaxID=2737049 RepID=UPI0015C48F64|nr:ABC transporter ATP-binding protein [Bacillus sp. EB106-08-02-XG196]NWQ41846.1 ABC transporter ATP-binding protein [Bacillus sp. EB106-08-02-XG196]